MTLTRRLLLLSLLSVLPAIAIWGFTEVALRREREAEVKDLALRQAQLAASELERIFQGVRGVLTAVGEMPAVQAKDERACTAYLQRLQPKVPHLLIFGVIDLNGRAVCSNQALPSPVEVGDRRYFRDAIATGEFTVGEHTQARVSRQAVLPFAQPLRDADGRPVGVIAVSLDLRWLGRELGERALPKDGSLTVADRTGVILAREPQPERFVGTRIPDSFLHLLDAAEAGAIEVASQDGTRRVLGYVPVRLRPLGVYVSAGLSASSAHAAIDASARRGLVLIAAAVAMSLALASLGARFFVTRPFQAIIAGVHAWRRGAYDARIALPRSAGELGLLAQAFNQLIEEVQSRERALTDSEGRARLALEAGQMGTWWFDGEKRTGELSPQAARLLGLPEEESTLTADEWLDRVHPDDRAATLAAQDVARTRGGEYEAEYRVRRPEGGWRWLNARARPLPDGRAAHRVVGLFQDVTARRQAEAEQDLLLHELNHRVKNTLATVQSVAQQTLRSAPSLAAFRETFEARLLALSKTHDLLTRSAWRNADLASLIEQEMAPYGGRDGDARFTAAGPPVRLPARVAINFGLVIHELTTNAAKYGALSAAGGRVVLSWTVSADPESTLILTWRETGGPPVRPPDRKGFGTRLIERTVVGELGGAVELRYLPTGFEARMTVPLAASQPDGSAAGEGSTGSGEAEAPALQGAAS